MPLNPTHCTDKDWLVPFSLRHDEKHLAVAYAEHMPEQFHIHLK
jgi:hypothetical protein